MEGDEYRMSPPIVHIVFIAIVIGISIGFPIGYIGCIERIEDEKLKRKVSP